MKPLNALASVLALSLPIALGTPLVHADPPGIPTQPMQPTGEASIANIIDSLARHHIFNHGHFSTSFNWVTRPQDFSFNSTGLPYPHSVNTTIQFSNRIFAVCGDSNRTMLPDGTCYTDAEAQDVSNGRRREGRGSGMVHQFFPLQITMSFQAYPTQELMLNQMRAAVWRMAVASAGLSVTAGEYAFNNYRHTFGFDHRFMPVRAEINEVVRVDHGGQLSLVLRGGLTPYMGYCIPTLPSAIAHMQNLGLGSNTGRFCIGGEANGQLGLRTPMGPRGSFSALAVASIDGQFFADHRSQAQEISQPDGLTTRRLGTFEGGQMIRGSAGGALEFQMNDRMQLRVSAINTYYNVNDGGRIVTTEQRRQSPLFTPGQTTGLGIREVTTTTNTSTANFGTTEFWDLNVGTELGIAF